MRHVLAGSALCALIAGGASAGGVERSTQSVAILFEQGSYAELSFGHVSPSVSGTQQVAAGGGSPIGSQSGDMTGSYTTVTLGYKTSLAPKIGLALVLDQPIGADVNYMTDTGYLYGGSSAAFGGSTATLDSNAVTAMIRYKISPNFSAIAGLRAVQTDGQVALFNGYTLSTSTETDYGYLLGVAYERPDIALRVALTYNSAITHDFDAAESGGGPATMTDLEVTIPKSWNLEFQSGIMADTLLFGSIRYVDWTAFEINPLLYSTVVSTRPLVAYESDTVTYNIGIGRRFNDTWSGSIAIGHEPAVGGFAGNLGPTDGFNSVQVGAVYTNGPIKVTGGIRYIDIGDADTQAPTPPFPDETTFATFTGNHAWAAGIRVGYSF